MIGFQTGHHFFVAGHDAGILGMVGGQGAEDFGHADGKPAVAASPVVGDFRAVEEEAVGFLEFVEVGGHFVGGAVGILGVLGGAVGLDLEAADHEHVVDPPAGFAGEAGGQGADPLFVSDAGAKFEVFLAAIIGAAVDEVDFQGDVAEDVGIHMVVLGDKAAAGGEDVIVTVHELLLEGGIADGVGEAEAAVGGADFRVDDEAFGFVDGVWAREKIFGDFFADGAGISIGGQVLETGDGGCVGAGGGGTAAIQQQGGHGQGQGGK